MLDLAAGGAPAQQVAAHDAPISCLRYLDMPNGSGQGVLVTAGWDKMVKVGPYRPRWGTPLLIIFAVLGLAAGESNRTDSGLRTCLLHGRIGRSSRVWHGGTTNIARQPQESFCDLGEARVTAEDADEGDQVLPKGQWTGSGLRIGQCRGEGRRTIHPGHSQGQRVSCFGSPQVIARLTVRYLLQRKLLLQMPPR